MQPMKQVEIWESELKAAGWRPLAAHPNSPAWCAPDGQLYPGPGFAHEVMTKQQTQSDFESHCAMAQAEADKASTARTRQEAK